MRSEDRQSPRYAAYVAMVAGPLVVVIAIFVSTFFVQVPMFVHMSIPVALLGYFIMATKLMNRQAEKPQGATPNLSPLLVESNTVGEVPRSAQILELVLLIMLGIAFIIIWIIPHFTVLLALSVLLGIMTGYCLTTFVRVENEIRRRVVAGGYTAPWWAASHAPVKRLRNVLFATLGTLILVALLFLTIPGLSLVLGMIIGSLLTGPSVRYRLLQLDSE